MHGSTVGPPEMQQQQQQQQQQHRHWHRHRHPHPHRQHSHAPAASACSIRMQQRTWSTKKRAARSAATSSRARSSVLATTSKMDAAASRFRFSDQLAPSAPRAAAAPVRPVFFSLEGRACSTIGAHARTRSFRLLSS